MKNPNVRMDGETQKQFNERRRQQNKQAKNAVYRVLWDSARKGTYIRAKHGEL
jgi:hypothetical protein